MDNIVFDRMEAENLPSVVKIIGVGGCGGNIVENICKKGLRDIKVDYALIDNDRKALDARKAVGDKHFVDKDDANLDRKLRAAIGNRAGIIIVIAGMGGENSAPIVSTLCSLFKPSPDDDDTKNNISIVYAVVPFAFERREKKVSNDLAMISEQATKVITFENDDLKNNINISINSAFEKVDEHAYNIINTLSQTILNSGIIIDYNDIATVLQYGDRMVFANGSGHGEKRMEEASDNMIKNIELSGTQMCNIAYMILLISFSKTVLLTPLEVYTTIDKLRCLIGDHLDILWGVHEDESLEDDRLTISAIMTVKN